ncbi:MAG: 30S ribosomal protein S6, partial [Proteobacteria bacterium]|nr:30S ribosomal protein S6 [Pseudomonadota bacterium]
MTLYEIVFIARQDITAAQVENMTQQYVNLIREEKGEVSKTEFCGIRNLAYPIKKNKKGHYVLMNIKTTPKTVQEIERLMKLNEDILRYLTVKVEEHDNTPS